MAIIRAARPDDLTALYAVSLATGFEGGDASHLYNDPDMIGHIYVAPYAVLEPELALVVQDSMGVAGFAVGVLDTLGWEDRLETEWWPLLRIRYPDPPSALRASWSHDHRRASMIHHPSRTPSHVSVRYPAHLHLNLLPRAQGVGLGMKLFREWQSFASARGIEAIHIGANRANKRAVNFWTRNGFADLNYISPTAPRTIWMGLS
ncbi:GNAT family N-acetyltransferase [Agrobacterium vitis]|uniref:GNAT family N-acetyltransferase n=1 Tax=Agrobacterium vitis TaxID=373 RepID=A0A6L6VJ63_AGRVI|nr:GNAT family N-acetyltransferase [Agrobacterium vitis]MUZ74908.1 GNAT family N-acetyltransferase [Agrobacterium vitis]MVA19929.1 GNAT family N-acetyltransferase [Agrobacterium vitis]